MRSVFEARTATICSGTLLPREFFKFMFEAQIVG